MAIPATNTRATIIPALSYRDAPAAVEWLCRAFGFAKHLVVPGPDNTITHAELTFANGMIMLGSVKDTDFGRHLMQPADADGKVTQTIYMIVDEVDAHYAAAKAAGARILIDIEDKPYGGRDYTCSDIEGHIWSFGTYDPWSAPKP